MLLVSLIYALLQAQRPLLVTAQSTTPSRPQFTVPASADVGLPVIANVNDPQAVNAQTVCPGYLASHVKQDDNGFSASLTLAGAPCNVYGTDIDELNLVVQFQSNSRLEINISPSNIVSDQSYLFCICEFRLAFLYTGKFDPRCRLFHPLPSSVGLWQPFETLSMSIQDFCSFTIRPLSLFYTSFALSTFFKAPLLPQAAMRILNSCVF